MANNERLVLEGERFNVYQMELNGSDGRIYHREVIRHPGAVVLDVGVDVIGVDNDVEVQLIDDIVAADVDVDIDV